MSTIKDELRQLAESLPGGATFDEVYRAYVLKKIEAGRRDGEAGRVMSQEEVERRFRRILQDLPPSSPA